MDQKEEIDEIEVRRDNLHKSVSLCLQKCNNILEIEREREENDQIIEDLEVAITSLSRIKSEIESNNEPKKENRTKTYTSHSVYNRSEKNVFEKKYSELDSKILARPDLKSLSAA